MIFARKNDIHFVIDEIKEVKKKFANLKTLLILEKESFDNNLFFYKLGIDEIFYNFSPESILKYLDEEIKNKFEKKESENDKTYIIDFYYSNNLFIIDISGNLVENNLTGLRLMFSNYLKEKIHSLKGIIYIFSDIHENDLSFRIVWVLFYFWKEIGINFSNITYLAQSNYLDILIKRYFYNLGIKKMENLIEAVKFYFPQLKNKSEMELFEFSSSLLSSQKRTKKSK